MDGDHHAEVLLDALEDALHTFEGALADDDLLAGLEGELHVLELDDLLVGILDDPDEVLHLLVGHTGYLGDGKTVLVVMLIHDITQVVIFGLVGLDVSQVLEPNTYEYVVLEGIDVGHFLSIDEAPGDIGPFDRGFLQEGFVQLILAFGAGMEDPHGVPTDFGFLLAELEFIR